MFPAFLFAIAVTLTIAISITFSEAITAIIAITTVSVTLSSLAISVAVSINALTIPGTEWKAKLDPTFKASARHLKLNSCFSYSYLSLLFSTRPECLIFSSVPPMRVPPSPPPKQRQTYQGTLVVSQKWAVRKGNSSVTPNLESFA